MRCGRIKRMLSACVDSELSEDKRAFVEIHTSRCPACRQEISDFRRGSELLSRKDSQAAGPLFWETLKSRLEEKGEEQTCLLGRQVAFDMGSWIRRLIPVTSALALIACGFLLRNLLEETSPVTVESVITANGVSFEETIMDSEEKISGDTVLRLVAYYPER